MAEEHQPDAQPLEADAYELLQQDDVDDDPPPYRPLGPGDVFGAIEFGHLASPITAPAILVGHPCSLRRGLALHDDIPVAPIISRGIPSEQRRLSERYFPVAKLLPPGRDDQGAVDLIRTTPSSTRS